MIRPAPQTNGGTDLNTNICNAIKRRAVIQFTYDGGKRSVEPHCHGTSAPGNEVLRGYQTGGHSESGNRVGWKLFDVSEIRSLQETGEFFDKNRESYNPNDSAMVNVHCHV